MLICPLIQGILQFEFFSLVFLKNGNSLLHDFQILFLLICVFIQTTKREQHQKIIYKKEKGNSWFELGSWEPTWKKVEEKATRKVAAAQRKAPRAMTWVRL